MKGLIWAGLVMIALLALAAVAAATTYGRKNVAYHENADFYDASSDAGTASGTWSSLTTTTSESITANGALVGDACTPLFGAAVSASNQALDYTCKVSASNTAILRVSNQTASAITPTRGKRGVHIVGH